MPIPLDTSPFTDRATLARDCPATSATSTYAIASCSASQRFRIERIDLIVDATYANDATNFYTLTVTHGATTAASWSTATAAQGAITGGTPASMVLSADTGDNLVVQPGEAIKLVATKSAAGANITPRVVVYGRFVQ